MWGASLTTSTCTQKPTNARRQHTTAHVHPTKIWSTQSTCVARSPKSNTRTARRHSRSHTDTHSLSKRNTPSSSAGVNKARGPRERERAARQLRLVRAGNLNILQRTRDDEATADASNGDDDGTKGDGVGGAKHLTTHSHSFIYSRLVYDDDDCGDEAHTSAVASGATHLGNTHGCVCLCVCACN